jgi:hypothetical protein
MRIVRSSDVEATAGQGVKIDTERREADREERKGADQEEGTETGAVPEGGKGAVREGEIVAARGGEIAADRRGEIEAVQEGVKEVDLVAEREADLEGGREVVQRIEEGVAQGRGVTPEGERNEEIQKHKEENLAVDQEVERERRMQAKLEH